MAVSDLTDIYIFYSLISFVRSLQSVSYLWRGGVSKSQLTNSWNKHGGILQLLCSRLVETMDPLKRRKAAC